MRRFGYADDGDGGVSCTLSRGYLEITEKIAETFCAPMCHLVWLQGFTDFARFGDFRWTRIQRSAMTQNALCMLSTMILLLCLLCVTPTAVYVSCSFVCLFAILDECSLYLLYSYNKSLSHISRTTSSIAAAARFSQSSRHRHTLVEKV